MKTISSLLILAFVISLTSCINLHIEKRQYRNGFYVSLGNDRDNRSAAVNDKRETKEVSAGESEELVTDNIQQPTAPRTESSQPVPVKSVEAPAATNQVNEVVRTEEESSRPEIKQGNTQSQESNPVPSASDTMLIIEVILAILIPPLAVFLHEGVTARFWITLILCLLGGGFIFYPVIGGLWLVAAIIALLVVLDAI